MQVKLSTILCKIPECMVNVNCVKPVSDTIGVLEGTLVIGNTEDELLEIRVPVNIKTLEVDSVPTSRKVNSSTISLIELISNCPYEVVAVTCVSLELTALTGWTVIEFTANNLPGVFTVVSYISLGDIIGSAQETKQLRRKLK